MSLNCNRQKSLRWSIVWWLPCSTLSYSWCAALLQSLYVLMVDIEVIDRCACLVDAWIRLPRSTTVNIECNSRKPWLRTHSVESVHSHYTVTRVIRHSSPCHVLALSRLRGRWWVWGWRKLASRTWTTRIFGLQRRRRYQRLRGVQLCFESCLTSTCNS